MQSQGAASVPTTQTARTLLASVSITHLNHKGVAHMKFIITETYQNWWDKSPRVTDIEITGATPDEAYAKYFREYDNASKYNNSVRYSFHDPDRAKEYREWFSDVNNYANNGGDMW
tara:strand:+ start:126 stop:473 length:348 start_codon:yes stop_codon:yes gene_type:complete